MVYHRALGVLTARAGARFLALLVDASLARVAVGIYQALWTTVWWRTDVVLKARANRTVVDVLADGIRAAR